MTSFHRSQWVTVKVCSPFRGASFFYGKQMSSPLAIADDATDEERIRPSCFGVQKEGEKKEPASTKNDQTTTGMTKLAVSFLNFGLVFRTWG